MYFVLNVFRSLIVFIVDQYRRRWNSRQTYLLIRRAVDGLPISQEESHQSVMLTLPDESRQQVIPLQQGENLSAKHQVMQLPEESPLAKPLPGKFHQLTPHVPPWWQRSVTLRLVKSLEGYTSFQPYFTSPLPSFYTAADLKRINN